jgi:hypothetical protein
MKIYASKTYKGGFTVVDGKVLVSYDAQGHPYSVDDLAFMPKSKPLDINTLDQSVACNILKATYWRIKL